MRSFPQGDAKRFGLARPPEPDPLRERDKRGGAPASRFATRIASIDRGNFHLLFVSCDQGGRVNDHHYLRPRLTSGLLAVESI
jgi:hypothetical protein